MELAEDIKAKQELIQQRKAELEGFQENVDNATRQRETLEREKEEARKLVEELSDEVGGVAVCSRFQQKWFPVAL